jgi:hypothetical protein
MPLVSQAFEQRGRSALALGLSTSAPQGRRLRTTLTFDNGFFRYQNPSSLIPLRGHRSPLRATGAFPWRSESNRLGSC